MEHLGFILLFLLATFQSSQSQLVVDRHVGDNAVLPCEVREQKVIALQWTQSDKCILIYRGGRVEKCPDDEFKDRVELQDPQITNGNLNVTLKNVRLDDRGNYTCEAFVKPSRRRRAVDPKSLIKKIQLRVSEKSEQSPEQSPEKSPEQSPEDEPTNNEPNNRLLAPSITSAVLFVCTVSILFIIYLKRAQIKQQRESKQSNTPALEPLKSPV